MAYKTINELPKSVREELPEAGQQLYLSAFKSAWEQLDPSDEATRMEVAHQAAWDEVRQTYEQLGNRWQRTAD